MALVTIYALIGDDVRMAMTSQPADLIFNVLTLVALLLFSIDMSLTCIAEADYFLSFFFFLDLAATITLIFDVTWIYTLLAGTSGASVAKAGRVSRVGTKAARILRVIRLLRLLRIVRLYRHTFQAYMRMKSHILGRSVAAAGPGTGTEEENYKESRVGQKLSHMTTQKVIVLILFLLIMLPLISVDNWYKYMPTTAAYGADEVFRAYAGCYEQESLPLILRNDSLACENFEKQLALFLGYHTRSCANGWDQVFASTCRLSCGWLGYSVRKPLPVSFKRESLAVQWQEIFRSSIFSPGMPTPSVLRAVSNSANNACVDPDYLYISLLSDVPCPEGLRLEEQELITPRIFGNMDSPTLIFVFDLRPWTVRSAVFNFLTMAFLCVALAVGSMLFSQDANRLVLQPIERMIAKVQKIKNNPLYAMKLGDETFREQQEKEEDSSSAKPSSWRCFWCGVRQQQVQTLETRVLENAIIKLGQLLALGFGEAGSQIIIKNMKEESATVNAMIPGSKVEAVLGFCKIQHFDTTIEVLQDKVLLFVNQVSQIVHTIVDSWHGAPNRNVGEGFLVVWRTEDYKAETKRKVGDMSIMSFVQVIAAVNKSERLKDYREHPALQARIPKYRVALGFGLHYGWAIEGAIGSKFKIDASYISPHVNMALRLEAETKRYQAEILLSEPLANLCTPETAGYLRKIDRVTLQGGMLTPLYLYTVDLNSEVPLLPEQPAQAENSQQAQLRRKREQTKDARIASDFQVHHLFSSDPDIVQMRSPYSAHFFQQFKKGFLNYEAGEWAIARRLLESASGSIESALGIRDGPSAALLDFMQRFNFDPSGVSAKGWPGFRSLEEGLG